MAAVATAWAAYQAASWRGEQAEAGSASISARVESTRAEGLENRQAQIDVGLFTQWVDAYARDETELTAFYRQRFRPQFRLAFEAWVATKPRTNPRRAPVAVRHAASTSSPPPQPARPSRSAGRDLVQARGEFIERADNYSLDRVLFAAALFFAGISTRLHARTSRVVVLGLGYALFPGSLIWMTTFPVNLSV